MVTNHIAAKVSVKTAIAYSISIALSIGALGFLMGLSRAGSGTQIIGVFLVFAGAIWVSVRFFLLRFCRAENLLICHTSDTGATTPTEPTVAIYWGVTWRVIVINTLASIAIKSIGIRYSQLDMLQSLVVSGVAFFLSTFWLLKQTYGDLKILPVDKVNLVTTSDAVSSTSSPTSLLNSINSFFAGALGFGAIGLYALFGLGELYWLWMSFKIGSFWMFVFGLIPPTMIVAALVGGYALIFEMPQWVYSWFG